MINVTIYPSHILIYKSKSHRFDDQEALFLVQQFRTLLRSIETARTLRKDQLWKFLLRHHQSLRVVASRYLYPIAKTIRRTTRAVVPRGLILRTHQRELVTRLRPLKNWLPCAPVLMLIRSLHLGTMHTQTPRHCRQPLLSQICLPICHGLATKTAEPHLRCHSIHRPNHIPHQPKKRKEKKKRRSRPGSHHTINISTAYRSQQNNVDPVSTAKVSTATRTSRSHQPPPTPQPSLPQPHPLYLSRPSWASATTASHPQSPQPKATPLSPSVSSQAGSCAPA